MLVCERLYIFVITVYICTAFSANSNDWIVCFGLIINRANSRLLTHKFNKNRTAENFRFLENRRKINEMDKEASLDPSSRYLKWYKLFLLINT